MDQSNSAVLNTQRKIHAASKTRRKLSIPVVLPQNSTGTSDAQAAFRRRFSNVGDVVTRKLSTTIGWRTGLTSPPEEVVAIGRGLCTLYVRTKLRKSGLFNKKLGLVRVRSALGTMTTCSNVVRDVFPGLLCACQELERWYPKLYSNILRHTGATPVEGNEGILLAVGHHIFRSEPTWGKLVAIYCIAGGLAIDYVRQGQSELLHDILEDMSELLETRVANWVHSNGGWTGLTTHCLQKDQEIAVSEYMTIFGLITVILLVAYFVVRFTVNCGW